MLVLAVRSADAEPAPCAPGAVLTGDAELVTTVAAHLHERGIATSPGFDCGIVHAQLARDPAGAIIVTIGDAAAGFERRTVSDAAVAATWVESWLYDERTLPVASMQARGASDVPPPAAAAHVPRRHRFAVSAGYEHAWLGDGNESNGVSVAAGSTRGAWSAGARIRITPETDTPAPVTFATTAVRSDVEVLAVASWSIVVGNLSISPEVGFGIGRTRTRRVDGCAKLPCLTGPCVEEEPPCEKTSRPGSEYYVHDGFVERTYTVRLAPRLSVALPVFARVWVEAGAAVTLLRGAHVRPYETLMSQPRDIAMLVDMPGEPDSALQLGIALRVGGL